MKIWSFHTPVGQGCAELYNYWVETPILARCSKCGGSEYSAPRHLDVAWVDGSDTICDFVFAVGPVVLKSQVADEILKKFSGFEKGEVRMRDHPTLRRPKRVTKRTPRRVWMPYEGPDLCFMRVLRVVPLHPSSTVEKETTCDKCGLTVYEDFKGIEEKSSVSHRRRKQGKGFFIEKKTLNGDDFFRPKHTGFTLCTDRAREFIQKRAFTNVEFLEVGDLI